MSITVSDVEGKEWAEGYRAGMRDAIIHAHWIRTPSLEYYQSDIECSNCEYDFTVDNICIEDYLRCPHCGAVMDEEDNEDD